MNAGDFDFVLPVVTEGGAQLCIEVYGDDDYYFRTERCGLEVDGAPILLELEDPPKFLTPAADDTFDALDGFFLVSLHEWHHQADARAARHVDQDDARDLRLRGRHGSDARR